MASVCGGDEQIQQRDPHHRRTANCYRGASGQRAAIQRAAIVDGATLRISPRPHRNDSPSGRRSSDLARAVAACTDSPTAGDFAELSRAEFSVSTRNGRSRPGRCGAADGSGKRSRLAGALPDLARMAHHVGTSILSTGLETEGLHRDGLGRKPACRLGARGCWRLLPGAAQSSRI